MSNSSFKGAPEKRATMRNWLIRNWEKLIFRAFGGVCFFFAVQFLSASDMPAFALTSGAGIFAFLYANFTKFRKFRGFGFEAELWEDKQAEAEQLIDKLKHIVSVYSREVIWARINHGRIYSGESERSRWNEIWKLYDEIVLEHSKLGDRVDFSEAKKAADTYFIFDAMIPTFRSINNIVEEGKKQALKKIAEQFGGSVITDAAGHHERISQFRAAMHDLGDPLSHVKQRILSSKLVDWFEAQQRVLKAFGVDVVLPEDISSRLTKFSAYERMEAISITPDLIEEFSALANARDS